jgi:hypothetical protein
MTIELTSDEWFEIYLAISNQAMLHDDNAVNNPNDGKRSLSKIRAGELRRLNNIIHNAIFERPKS